LKYSFIINRKISIELNTDGSGVKIEIPLYDCREEIKASPIL
jgi:hypothetical protein